MYKPGSYTSGGGYGERYEDDRYEGSYGSRDEDPNGYGREREWRSRDDDKYSKYGDSSNRDRDYYGRESEERSGRDGYKDNSSRGRSQNGDDYNYGVRSKSSERDRTYEDDSQYSSRYSTCTLHCIFSFFCMLGSTELLMCYCFPCCQFPFL